MTDCMRWPAVESCVAFDDIVNCTGPADCFDIRGDASVAEDLGAAWCAGHIR
jgi:hypothetical protein